MVAVDGRGSFVGGVEMSKPDWKDAPNDATHCHPTARLAKWYKIIDGVWHYYYYPSGRWCKSTGFDDVVDYLEPRP